MAHPIVFGGKTEIEADGLGVPNMRIAIWLWRKAGDDTAIIFVTSPIFCDDLADKVRRGVVSGVGMSPAPVSLVLRGLAPNVGCVLVFRVSKEYTTLCKRG